MQVTSPNFEYKYGESPRYRTLPVSRVDPRSLPGVVVDVKHSAIVIPGFLPAGGQRQLRALSPLGAAEPRHSAAGTGRYRTGGNRLRLSPSPLIQKTHAQFNKFPNALQTSYSRRLSETARPKQRLNSTQTIRHPPFKKFRGALMTLGVGPPCLPSSAIFHSTDSILGGTHLHKSPPTTANRR